MSTEPARPRPPRRPPPRKIQATLALLLAGVALLAGVVVGYVANGDSEPAGRLITESRELPVVTITQTVTRPVTITQTVTAPRRTTSGPDATTTAPDGATTTPADGVSP